jgi:TIR domain
MQRGVTPRQVASVFISYRVESGRAYAGRLYDRLAMRFSAEALFFDKGSIRGGEGWLDRIERELDGAAAVLAIIDPQWAQSFPEPGEAQDFVELELRTAIEQKKTIIPLLVGGVQTMPERSTIPSTLHALLGLQWVVLHDTSVDDYSSSVARLIAMLSGLAGVMHAVEEQAVALLMRRQYAEAERILLRQPDEARGRARSSAYLALARLAGRSFNALHPKERDTIEGLLRSARAADPWWTLPAILLAILDIDYYEAHGLVSAEPMPASTLRNAELDERSRLLLTGMRMSRRALQELQLESLSGSTA